MMSTQTHTFELYSPIGFGQYSILPVEEIYTGTGFLPISWCQQEVQKALIHFKPLGQPYHKFFNIYPDGKYLKVVLNEDYSKVDYFGGVHLNQFDVHREINNILTEIYYGIPNNDAQGSVASYSEEFFIDHKQEKLLLDILLIELEITRGNKQVMRVERNVLKNGKPSYISWLIQNVDFFSLQPADLAKLEGLEINSFFGIWLKQIDQVTFELGVAFTKRREVFSEHMKQLNKVKWEAFWSERGKYQDVAEEEDRREEYSNPWADLHTGCDDDEDNIMRGLSNGNGDQFGF